MSYKINKKIKFLCLCFLERFSFQEIDCEEFRQDEKYRGACFASLSGLLAGLAIYSLFSGMFRNCHPALKLLLGLLPYQLFAFGATIALLLPVFREYGYAKTLDIFPQPFFTGANAAVICKSLAVIYPVIALVNRLSVELCNYLNIPIQKQSIAALAEGETGTLFWIAAAFTAIITAPLTEELTMRLVLHRTLRSYVPVWADVLTSLIFAFLHGQPQFLAGLFIVGMFLQRAKRLGGLPLSIALHASFNFISFVIIIIFQGN